MIAAIKRIANYVPAICVVSGLLAVFIAGEEVGWVFVGGGALLQILMLFSRRITGNS